MAFLVRKISRAKWPDENCEIENLNGDAIGDLRTQSNTLSLWRINSEEELCSAALALAASSKSSKVEAISVVWIPEEIIREKHIGIADISGDTVVHDLVHTHRDLCDITYGTLGEISAIIIDEMIQAKRYKRFTKTDVKKALAQAYKDKRIAEEKCLPELLQEIKKAANS